MPPVASSAAAFATDRVFGGLALAVDVGGTKIATAMVDGGGQVLTRARVATPVSDDPTDFGDALTNAVRQVTDAVGLVPAMIGIGSAGPLDPVAGTISPVNIPALRGYPIVGLVSDAFPGVPACLAGDGHCMALGEYWRSVPPSRALLGMVVSTGVGGGIVVDGRIQIGPTGNAGHVGHLVVDPDGPACPCGGRGCVEVFSSGPCMVRWAQANGWTPPSADAGAASLAESARAGHPVAVRAFERAAGALAMGVISAAAIVDLDDVVLGGGVVNGAGDLLLDPIRRRIDRLAGPSFIRRIRVSRSVLGGDAGLLGAAALGFAAGEGRIPAIAGG